MLRSVKYGLYGAVIAGVVAGTATWHSTDKTVRLVVDGQPVAMRTTAARVADVLRAKNLAVGPHDILAPAADAALHNGSTVVLRRGRLLHLDVNGALTDVWTTAPTVADALTQLGYSTADFTSVSRDRRLPLTATDLTIRTPQLVNVVVDGKSEQVTSTDATVGQLLTDMGVTLERFDRVAPLPGDPLPGVAAVTVTRVTHRTKVMTKSLPFHVSSSSTSALPAGVTQVVKAGHTGTAQVTYDVVFIDGHVVGETPVSTTVVHAPVTQVQRVGAHTAAAPTAMPSAGSAQAWAKAYMQQRYGWGQSQFNCLVQLWDHESGWRVNAGNPSGAYGIPQALPGDKMSTAGADWQTSASTQIAWGLSYIAGHYGTPCGAWSSWQANGWY